MRQNDRTCNAETLSVPSKSSAPPAGLSLWRCLPVTWSAGASPWPHDWGVLIKTLHLQPPVGHWYAVVHPVKQSVFLNILCAFPSPLLYAYFPGLCEELCLPACHRAPVCKLCWLSQTSPLIFKHCVFILSLKWSKSLSYDRELTHAHLWPSLSASVRSHQPKMT